MRRAKLEGPQIGRAPLQVDHPTLLRDPGMSLKDLVKTDGISRATVCRVRKDAPPAVSKGCASDVPLAADNKQFRPPITAA